LKVKREWRKLHYEELHDLYCSPNIIREIKSRIMRRMGEASGVHWVFGGALEGKKPLGRPPCRREDNIKINLYETESEDVDWINLA
jgi:hypothetical protein